MKQLGVEPMEGFIQGDGRRVITIKTPDGAPLNIPTLSPEEKTELLSGGEPFEIASVKTYPFGEGSLKVILDQKGRCIHYFYDDQGDGSYERPYSFTMSNYLPEVLILGYKLNQAEVREKGDSKGFYFNWGLGSSPKTYHIDKEGNISNVNDGFRIDEELTEKLKDLLREKVRLVRKRIAEYVDNPDCLIVADTGDIDAAESAEMEMLQKLVGSKLIGEVAQDIKQAFNGTNRMTYFISEELTSGKGLPLFIKGPQEENEKNGDAFWLYLYEVAKTAFAEADKAGRKKVILEAFGLLSIYHNMIPGLDLEEFDDIIQIYINAFDKAYTDYKRDNPDTNIQGVMFASNS